MSEDVKEDVKIEETDGIIEQDGELYVEIEEEEAPESSPDKGEEDDDKVKDSKAADKPEKSDEDESSYKGKSREEIIAMHRNASKKISEQGKELGEYRQKVADNELDTGELLKKLKADDLKSAFMKEKALLDQMNPAYDTNYDKQKAVVDRLQTDWLEKRQDELLSNRFRDQDNEAFIAKTKADYEKDGIKLADAEFEAVTELAKDYAVDGRLDKNAMTKAMIDVYGAEKVLSFQKISAEQKARKDIVTASAKTDPRVDVSGSGKNSRLVRFDDMDEVQMERSLRNLSDKQLEKLQTQLNKRR